MDNALTHNDSLLDTIESVSDADCSGCAACSAACPVRAISMAESPDGFPYPRINETLCIHCRKCQDACGALNQATTSSSFSNSYYAASLKDACELDKVSSGGVFWALAQSIISRNGIVYGAVRKADLSIHHTSANDIESASRMKGSKYQYSDASHAYTAAKKDLDAGHIVMFSGTPCQIEGLKLFLGKDYSNLLSCAIACHGIPSSKAFRNYCAEAEAAAKSKIADIKCRDKSLGWKDNCYAVHYENGTIDRCKSVEHPFHRCYLAGLMNRSSCGHCRYSTLSRGADITLADFWRYSGPLSRTSEGMGISLVVCSTNKGEEEFRAAGNYINCEPADEKTAISSCRHLTHTPAESPDRAAFLEALNHMKFHEASELFVKKPTPKDRLKQKLRRRVGSMKQNERPSGKTASIPERDLQALRDYYESLNMKTCIPESPLQYLSTLARHDKSEVLIIESKLLRALAKPFGMHRRTPLGAASEARRLMAFREALLLLNRKNVPVFYCNRIGRKKDGFAYSESARRRMRRGDSFPKLCNHPQENAETFKELLGPRYSPEYVRGLTNLPQVIKKDGRYVHEDRCSSLINVVGGMRVTPQQPETFTKTLHVYGRCGAFGYAVEDAETLPSFLQRYLNEVSEEPVRVINHGLWGGDDSCIIHNFIVDSQEFVEGDMVLFYMKHPLNEETCYLERTGMVYYDITERWHMKPEAKWCFYDRPGHMGAEGYRNAAEIIVEELLARRFVVGEAEDYPAELQKAKHYNEYLKNQLHDGFDDELEAYLDSIKEAFPPAAPNEIRGAIVMNCNPFTFGHLHLIKFASTKVDVLYVFVVEEDKSFFKFEDRFEMVSRGVTHLDNVRVCPSGKFMISALTFPEYFMKDYVKERNFDASSDLDIFSRRIAPALGISMRFAGEEPTDPVTARYNEEMSRLLPELGVEFCEIPRLQASDGKPLSATKVRELLSQEEVDELKKYVPETTLIVLREKYMSI